MPEQPESLQAIYQRRFAKQASYRNRVWQVLCRSYFEPLFGQVDSILELGAGWGEFSNNISNAGRRLAMDLNPDSRSRLDDAVEFLHQDCSDRWPLEDESLDAVFTSNFLEHLPDKRAIERTLGEAYRCLRPGGRIVCLGPNIKYVPGEYWDFWDHYVPITEHAMGEALEGARFVVERKLGRFLPYSMSGGFNPPVGFVSLYLKLPLAWRFFGKQFLVCALKGD